MPRSGTLGAGPRAAGAAGVRADLHMGEKSCQLLTASAIKYHQVLVVFSFHFSCKCESGPFWAPELSNSLFHRSRCEEEEIREMLKKLLSDGKQGAEHYSTQNVRVATNET